jgi:putative heme transporter
MLETDVTRTPTGRRAPRRAATPLSRPVKRVVKLLVVLAVINYLVLPQLARADFRLLLTVDLWLVALGTLLQIGKLVAYTVMTKPVAPNANVPPFWPLFRIQLSTWAVSHVVPGGTAAGGVLGYRLLSQQGMRGTDAAFVMATQGILSAIILNVVLWVALVISIPLRGFHPVYGAIAVAGVVLIGAFALLVVLLVRGEERAAGAIGSIAGRLPFLEPDAVERIARRIALHIQALATNPTMALRACGWATVSWLADAASLWVFAGAFGHWVPIDGLLIAFGIANVLASIPITPQGLGLVEGWLVPSLVGFGAPSSIATLGVLAYRLVNFWLPIPIGGLAYLSLEVERGIAERRSDELRQLAEESIARAEDGRAWAQRHGVRVSGGRDGHAQTTGGPAATPTNGPAATSTNGPAATATPAPGDADGPGLAGAAQPPSEPEPGGGDPPAAAR